MKGIIFDFNGTLFWDTPLHEASWIKYAKDRLNIDLSKEYYYKCIHGSTNPLIYEKLYNKPMPTELMGIFGEEKEEYYRSLCREKKDELTLTPTAYELLDFLKSNNIPHAIATSSEINNVNFFKELFSLNNWFDDEYIIYDDGTVKGKPHPDIYLKAGKALGIPMRDLIVVEDANAGVQAAKAAGAGLVVGIAPYGKENFVGKKYTDLIISDFSELSKDLFK